MKLAIMQPYFLPYLGYWQLMAATKVFVVYDNLKYTKKSWIKHNRFLRNGEAAMFTLPLTTASDALMICERWLVPGFDPMRLLRAFREAYRQAPHYAEVAPLIQRIMWFDNHNLFAFVAHSLALLRDALEIPTSIVISSSVGIDHSLRGQDKVLAICEAFSATEYVNAPGGKDLYSKEAFAACGIELQFIQPQLKEYPQLGAPFVPGLSILDVLMFNGLARTREMIFNDYEVT